MQHLIQETLDAMVKSQEQLARSMHAQSRIVQRMARMIRRVDPREITVLPGEPYTEAEQAVARQISGYVHTLADFEHALADHVKFAIKELRIAEEE